MAHHDQSLGHDRIGHDDFANFQFEPPKTVGRFRPFIRRNKLKTLSRGMRPSQDGLSSLSGSTQNLLDQSKLMNLQEDARSRRISSEIMKHRLYESVISSPRRRRMSSSIHCGGDSPDGLPAPYYMHATRMAMSVPVTPMTSQRTTPAHSPTTMRKFMFGFFSNKNTPDDDFMDVDMFEEVGDPSCKGIASIFKPQPKCVPGARWAPRIEQDELMTEKKLLLQDVPKGKGRNSHSRSSSSSGED